MLKQRVAELARSIGMTDGTYPEKLAAVRLSQWGHTPARQYRVGRYSIDFAWPHQRIALEIDGPHHGRPDVAAKDAYRDQTLRNMGWVVLRVNAGEALEDHLARVSEIIHSLPKETRA